MLPPHARPAKRVHSSSSVPILRPGPSPLSRELISPDDAARHAQASVDARRGRSASEQVVMASDADRARTPTQRQPSTSHLGASSSPRPTVAVRTNPSPSPSTSTVTTQRTFRQQPPLRSPIMDERPYYSDAFPLPASAAVAYPEPPPLPPPKGSRARSATLASAYSASSSPPLVGGEAFEPPQYAQKSVTDEQKLRKRRSLRRLPAKAVPTAPPTLMYWSKAPTQGYLPQRGMRAFTGNLVTESTIWFYGGCDAQRPWDELLIFDTDTYEWYRPEVRGERPPALRSHSATLHEANLFVFGGGDENAYFNDLYVLDTITQTWRRLPIQNSIPPRRAHAAFVYEDRLYIWGGGNGQEPLDDMWRLDVAKLGGEMRWERVETRGPRPVARGYQSANLIGNTLVSLGGSGHGRPHKDCWFLDMETLQWEERKLTPPVGTISHSATLVGMYLFVFGGHDGAKYRNELHLLNLITMQWENKQVRGLPPSPRAQHVAILTDARLWIFGGFDGKGYFEDVYVLDLASNSYLAHITEFVLAGEDEEWEDGGTVVKTEA